ncbi:MAG: hypothetical protein JWN37_123 [Candidatus Nomurabacteria bacterium]|nr:hypothetical protein [Candidatus Nomurabacteria bacterium]
MANQDAVAYISQLLSQKVSKEEITHNLLAEGWNEGDINNAFAEIEKIAIPVPPQPPVTSEKPPVVIMMLPASSNHVFWKVTAAVLGAVLVLLILFIAWGFYLNATDPQTYGVKKSNLVVG